MPPRPPAIPFSIGVDMTRNARFRPFENRRMDHGHDELSVQRMLQFLGRIFTPVERKLFWLRFGASVGQKSGLASRFIASRWAAKEAVIKAVKHRRLFMSDVEIHTRRDGPFAIVLDKSRPPSDDGDGAPALEDLLKAAKAARTPSVKEDSAGDVEVIIDSATGPTPTETSHDEGGVEVLGVNSPRYVAAAEEALATAEGQVVRISISHDGEYSVATAIAAIEPSEGDVGGEAAARSVTGY